MPLISSTPDETPWPSRMSRDEALSQLIHGEAAERRQAALDLAGEDGATAALAVHLAAEDDPTVRQAVLSALVKSEASDAVDALIKLLGSEDAERRNEAVAALSKMVEPVAARMERLLANADPDIRIMAIDILRLLPHPDAPLWLRKMLATETHENVVGAAVDRLAEIGGSDDLPILRATRDRFSDFAYIRFATEIVIARIETLAKESG